MKKTMIDPSYKDYIEKNFPEGHKLRLRLQRDEKLLIEKPSEFIEREFTLLITDPIDASKHHLFFEAGCGDGNMGCRNYVTTITFNRLALSQEEAVASAIQDVKDAGFTAVLVEDENY